MNRFHGIRAALATSAGALLALAAAPAALASPLRPPPPHLGGASGTRAPVHVIVQGGMPGWQITLIAAGTALAAAALAVLLDHARAARKAHTTTAGTATR